MAIVLKYQPIGAPILAAYATGVGQANERRRKEAMVWMDRQQQRQDRFLLEGNRQNQAWARLEAGQKFAAGENKKAWDERRAAAILGEEMGAVAKIDEGVLAGELEYSPEASKDIKMYEDYLLTLRTDPRYKPIDEQTAAEQQQAIEYAQQQIRNLKLHGFKRKAPTDRERAAMAEEERKAEAKLAEEERKDAKKAAEESRIPTGGARADELKKIDSARNAYMDLYKDEWWVPKAGAGEGFEKNMEAWNRRWEEATKRIPDPSWVGSEVGMAPGEGVLAPPGAAPAPAPMPETLTGEGTAPMAGPGATIVAQDAVPSPAATPAAATGEPPEVAAARKTLTMPQYVGSWSPQSISSQATPEMVKEAKAVIKEWETTGSTKRQKQEAQRIADWKSKLPTFSTDAEVTAAFKSGDIPVGASFIGPDNKVHRRTR